MNPEEKSGEEGATAGVELEGGAAARKPEVISAPGRSDREMTPVGFDHINTIVRHDGSSDHIDVLVNVPLVDGAVAETKITLNSPLRSVGTTGKNEYSMKVDTNLSVLLTQRKSSGRTDLQDRDGLWWEIPAGYPGAITVLLEHEPKVKQFLTSHFRPGDVFVDVGANAGAYTLRALSGGMKVYAFEPNPENVKLLKRNAALNDLSIEVQECALGASDGRVRISQNGATSRIGSPIDGVEVPLHTLDSFAIPRVDLLKVDVEGYELEVLRGARGTLARCRPALMVEMHHWIGAKAEAEIFNILLGSGYTFEYLDTYVQGRHLIARAEPPGEPRVSEG